MVQMAMVLFFNDPESVAEAFEINTKKNIHSFEDVTFETDAKKSQ